MKNRITIFIIFLITFSCSHGKEVSENPKLPEKQDGKSKSLIDTVIYELTGFADTINAGNILKKYAVSVPAECCKIGKIKTVTIKDKNTTVAAFLYITPPTFGKKCDGDKDAISVCSLMPSANGKLLVETQSDSISEVTGASGNIIHSGEYKFIELKLKTVVYDLNPCKRKWANSKSFENHTEIYHITDFIRYLTDIRTSKKNVRTGEIEYSNVIWQKFKDPVKPGYSIVRYYNRIIHKSMWEKNYLDKLPDNFEGECSIMQRFYGYYPELKMMVEMDKSEEFMKKNGFTLISDVKKENAGECRKLLKIVDKP